jgi:hypothetical protein
VPEVHLQSHLSYRNIAVTSENKLVYLLVDVAPSAGLGLGPAALNLAIVLDKSGSMYAHEKLDTSSPPSVTCWRSCVRRTSPA